MQSGPEGCDTVRCRASTIVDPHPGHAVSRRGQMAAAAKIEVTSGWSDRPAEAATGAGRDPRSMRTRGMKSSAMREMMALTERPDVISLAGGLPDTSTFAPELYARLMADVAAE